MDELSDTKIRNATPADKEYAITDGQGLSVVVRPNGTKLWLYRYRFGGKRKNMSLGTFPGVGLKAAREKRHNAEKLLDQGQDPVAVREAKRQEDEKLKHTFRAVGEEWATTKLEKENKAKSTIKRERWNLAQLNREIGDRPLCEIAPPELLTAFRRVEARGRYYTVGRLRSTASRVFQFGVGASYCNSDPTRDLKHALTKAPKGNPRPALTDPDDVGDLMRRIEVYDAKNGGLVRYALKLIALTMVRPGELRLAEWTEFDEKNRIWLIPAEKMKMRDDHEVPLSRQALAILAELRPLTGRGRYLFSHDDDVLCPTTRSTRPCGSWATIPAPVATTVPMASDPPPRPCSTKKAHSMAMWWKLSSPMKRTKKRGGAATMWCGASLPRATRTRYAASTTERLIGANACA
jgi:integrase